MKKKLLYFKMLALLACMLCSIGAAAAEAYACYTSSNTTLTFYYDNYRSSRTGTTYDLNTDMNFPVWNSDSTNRSVTRVVFNSSFANARPTSTYRWFDNMTQLQSITGIQYLNTSNVTNMGLMFYTCSSLTSLDVSHFNTSNVTNMSWTFASCSGLTSLDVSSFNTSNVTDMHCMFSACSGLTSLDLGNFNTANVTDMGFMFSSCSGLTNLNVSSFNTAKVTNMEFMFRDCSGLTNLDVTHFNTASVTRMKNLFDGCTGLTSLDVSSFNTSNVTDMHCMFWGCSGLTSLDVTHFNTAKVTDMSLMFASCSGLTNLDVTHFNTSNVTTMARIFERCSGLTSIDVSGFNTSKVTDMSDMFYDSPALTSVDLSSFNTSNVIYMSSMFNSCSSLTSLDLSSFNTAKVTKMDFMFSDCTSLTTIYVGNGWGTAAVTQSNYMFRDCTSLVGGQGTTYDANHMDVAYAHIDGGPSNPGYLTEKLSEPAAYACFTADNRTLTFYYDDQRSTRPGTIYNLNTPGSDPEWLYVLMNSVCTKAVFDPSFADARPTSTRSWFYRIALYSIEGLEYLNTTDVTDMAYMFCGCDGLISLDVSGLNTANVTDMQYMLYGCMSVTSLDVSHFNTANVTNMASMFGACESLTSLDVSGFKTANVTDMSGMFRGCSHLTSLDVSNFSTSQVTDMNGMFDECSSLTSLDLSTFNTSSVTNMQYMFQECYALTNLDLSNFNTANVTTFQGMFEYCKALTSLDLSSFNTANVNRMTSMFHNCINLVTIYVGDEWNTEAVTRSTGMFSRCTSLVGGKGTAYDASHVDAAYAHIDGGPDNPGYFSERVREAYAVYTPDNTTLTFYYDFQRSARPGTTYDLNTGSSEPGWMPDGIYSSVTQVIFDESFADAHPVSTYYWFYGMSDLVSIIDINNLNTEDVRTMRFMFGKCGSLTSLDLSQFNTATVTDMSYMFAFCAGLTSLDLSSFNTARVTNMSNMFYKCGNLTTIFVGDGWTTASVQLSSSMFSNCTSLVGGQGTAYDANHVDVAYAHIDGGSGNPGYLSAKPEAYAVFSPDNTTLTFYYDNLRSSRLGTAFDLNEGYNTAPWCTEDGEYTAPVTQAVFDPSFAGARPTTTFCWFADMTRLQSITGLEYLNTSDVNYMNYMFYYCNGLTTLDLSNFNTANVMDMTQMFYQCGNLTTIYVSDGWSTDAVTDSYRMFYGSTSLVGGQGTTYDANHVDVAYAHIDGGLMNPGYFTEKLPEAYAVYTSDNTTLTFYCDFLRSTRPGTTYDLNTGSDQPQWIGDRIYRYVTQVVFDPSFADARPVSTLGWFYCMEHVQSITGIEYLNTSETTNFGAMFTECSGLTSLDVTHFDTSKATTIFNMFNGCSSLTSIDVSGFNTAKVQDLRCVFRGCSSLTKIDLSSFSTSLVINMIEMFKGCSQLTTVYVGDGWDTDNVYYSADMFLNCTSLVGGQGTTYDANHADKEYAHIDGGPDNPGYFSEKPAFMPGDVSGDGNTNITDVTALINYLLSHDASGVNVEAADVNNDGRINITDVTILINYLLSHDW